MSGLLAARSMRPSTTIHGGFEDGKRRALAPLVNESQSPSIPD